MVVLWVEGVSLHYGKRFFANHRCGDDAILILE
jgi:hypothetical protein